MSEHTLLLLEVIVYRYCAH